MGISSGASSAQAAGQGGAAVWQQRQQSLQALAKALQSSDLGQAKAAYASLASASGAAASNPNSALAQLGKALQSGDLGGAQQAFAAMRSHRHQSSSASAQGSTQPAAPTATTGNYLNVVA
jgi:hypothetical protein